MASKTFQFKLITPQGKLIDSPAVAVQVPAHDGQMGVLPDRAPIVTTLGLGTLKVTLASAPGKSDGGVRQFYIEDGFLQMVNNKLTVLTSKAIAAEELVEADVKAELASADAKKPVTPDDMGKITRARDAARAKLRLAQAGR